jgi:hypothetical protein
MNPGLHVPQGDCPGGVAGNEGDPLGSQGGQGRED